MIAKFKPTKMYNSYMLQRGESLTHTSRISFEKFESAIDDVPHLEAIIPSTVKDILPQYEKKGVIYNWLREQPIKMRELYHIVQHVKPDIVMFMDTAGRPSGIIFDNYCREIGEQRNFNIEYIAPPERIVIDEKVNDASGLAELNQKQINVYNTNYTAALRKRLSETNYTGKRILLVDEVVSSGSQIATLKKIALDCGIDTITVGLGVYKSHSAIPEHVVENVDYLLGEAETPPWSKYVRASTSEGIGIRKLPPMEWLSNNTENLKPVVRNDQDQTELTAFRDDLKKIARYSAEVYAIIGDTTFALFGNTYFDISQREARELLLEQIVSKIANNKYVQLDMMDSYIINDRLKDIFYYLLARDKLAELYDWVQQLELYNTENTKLVGKFINTYYSYISKQKL